MTIDDRLDAALAELGAALRKKRNPTRFHARGILLAVGELALSGNPAAASAGAERVAAIVGDRHDDWARAVHEEIEMAGVEFVRSVDPKYLEHPRYDLAYTVAARERLEARLAAVEALGISPPDELLEQISAADERLAPHLKHGAGRARPGGSGERPADQGRPH